MGSKSTRMGHSDALLAACKNNDERQMVARQNEKDMPACFIGYVRAGQIDTVATIMDNDLKWQKLPIEHRKSEADPVSARIFNTDGFLGNRHADGPMQALSGTMMDELWKVGCPVVIDTDMLTRKHDKIYKSYVAIPTVKIVGTPENPSFERDIDSSGTFIAYLLAKTYQNHEGQTVPLATPKAIAEAFGYSFLIEGMKPEKAALLKEQLGLDHEAQVKKAFASDPKEAGRVLAYMLNHHAISPEAVEQRFGAEMLERACSQENVRWLRSLRGFSDAGELSDEMPNAARYLKERALSTKQNSIV